MGRSKEIGKQATQSIFGGCNVVFMVGVGGNADSNLPVAGVKSETHLCGVEGGFFQKGDEIRFADAGGEDGPGWTGTGVGKAVLEPWKDFLV